MSFDLEVSEPKERAAIKLATDELLFNLQRHHTFDVPAPPKKIIIEAKESVAESVEVCVLPVVEGRLTIEAIKRVVCKHFAVSHTDLISTRRDHKIILPRMIAIYLVRELTPLTLPSIGRHFGNRDHTTILHSVRKVAALVVSKGFCSQDVSYLREHLCA